MAHQVKWCSYVLERFAEVACLSEEEIWIMETRIKGMPISRQAMELNCSESTVHKKISMLKKKYDNAAEHDSTLPPRKKSLKETWMDEH